VSYATIDELKAAITIADTADDADLQRALDAATEWINHYTGRTFTAAEPATAKRFYPTEQDRLSIPDVQSVTLLEIDTAGDGTFAQTLEATDYELLPLYPDVGAYTEIHLLSGAPWWFVVGYQARVTGAWGFGTVPASVVQACILLANRYFHRPSAPFGVWEAPTTGQLGDVPDTDVDVMNLLAPYVTSGGAGGTAGAAAWVMV